MSNYNHIDIEDKVLALKRNDYVLNVCAMSDGSIVVSEGCDDYYSSKYSKDEAIAMFEEIISAIKNGDLL